MRLLPKYHVTAKTSKKVKGGTIMTINITKIGTQQAAPKQMLTLSELRSRHNVPTI